MEMSEQIGRRKEVKDTFRLPKVNKLCLPWG